MHDDAQGRFRIFSALRLLHQLLISHSIERQQQEILLSVRVLVLQRLERLTGYISIRLNRIIDVYNFRSHRKIIIPAATSLVIFLICAFQKRFLPTRIIQLLISEIYLITSPQMAVIGFYDIWFYIDNNWIQMFGRCNKIVSTLNLFQFLCRAPRV